MEIGVNTLLSLRELVRSCRVSKLDYRHKDPKGRITRYRKLVFCEVMPHGIIPGFYLGYRWKKVWGSRRRAVDIFTPRSSANLSRPSVIPLVEFIGTDNYSLTRELVSVIRKPDLKFMKLNEVNYFLEYLPLKHLMVDHSRVIRGGYKGTAALKVKENRVELMLLHASIQFVWKRLKGA